MHWPSCPCPELSRHSGALHAARSPARAQSQGQSPSPPAMPFPRPGHCPSRLLRNARPQGQESARAAGHGIGDRVAAGGLRRAQAPARQAHGPPTRPRSAARVGPGPGDARRRGLPLRLRGSACRMPSPPSPLLPAATPRELRGRGLAPRPRHGFPGPFGRESSISVA